MKTHLHGETNPPGSTRISSLTDARLDLSHNGSRISKSFIVASSYRSGSTMLCVSLWRTGVLGAPWEYVNPEFELKAMMKRLAAASAEDYFEKLVGCRTTGNGVFGMKAHFPHFEAALAQYPLLLDRLQPLTYIYITRRDKIAQAVSMAKAYQTKSWTSLVDPKRDVYYDRAQIERCRIELETQKSGWLKWFEAENISPFVVNYEDLIEDEPGVVSDVMDLMEVKPDDAAMIDLPLVEKQGDAVNDDWVARFRAGQ